MDRFRSLQLSIIFENHFVEMDSMLEWFFRYGTDQAPVSLARTEKREYFSDLFKGIEPVTLAASLQAVVEAHLEQLQVLRALG